MGPILILCASKPLGNSAPGSPYHHPANPVFSLPQLQGEEREGDLCPGKQGLGEEVPAELPSQLLLHPQLEGRPEAAQGVPSTGDGTPQRRPLFRGGCGDITFGYSSSSGTSSPSCCDDPHHLPEGKGPLPSPASHWDGVCRPHRALGSRTAASSHALSPVLHAGSCLYPSQAAAVCW